MAALPIMAIVAALAAVVAIEKKHQEQVEAEAQATYGLTEEQKNELSAYILECEKQKLDYRKKKEKCLLCFMILTKITF